MSGVKRNAILTSELRMFMKLSVKFRTKPKFIDIVRLNRGDKFDVRRFLSYISFSIRVYIKKLMLVNKGNNQR